MTRQGTRRASARTACRAVGYVRRSTDRQEQSIPDQKKALEAYAVEHGLRLGKFYIDDAISGTSTTGRRAFQQLIQDAQSPSQPFVIVVVYDIKRFGRVDNDEAGYCRHVLRTHGVEVRYVSENFNGDATDDLLRLVKQWQARQESKDLSKVTIRGLLSKMQDEGAGAGGGNPLDLPHASGQEYEVVLVIGGGPQHGIYSLPFRYWQQVHHLHAAGGPCGVLWYRKAPEGIGLALVGEEQEGVVGVGDQEVLQDIGLPRDHPCHAPPAPVLSTVCVQGHALDVAPLGEG